MGYSFYIISKEKEISKSDFDTAMSNLSEFNRKGLLAGPPCDVDLNKNYIKVSGAYGMSGQYAEGFVLNMVMCLLDLDYKPRVISEDWKYGTKDDWKWFNKQE